MIIIMIKIIINMIMIIISMIMIIMMITTIMIIWWWLWWLQFGSSCQHNHDYDHFHHDYDDYHFKLAIFIYMFQRQWWQKISPIRQTIDIVLSTKFMKIARTLNAVHRQTIKIVKLVENTPHPHSHTHTNRESFNPPPDNANSCLSSNIVGEEEVVGLNKKAPETAGGFLKLCLVKIP